MSRCATLRKCVDRIGFGGYLSLAVKFPDFLDYVEKLANEFREIVVNSGQTKPWTASFKVVILDSWGKLRSWIGGPFKESLAGMPFDMEFMNFEDLKSKGLPEGTKVVINAGHANTSWSGGWHWADEQVVAIIREFVHRGGGFIGIWEPSAFERIGKFFQLSDILGVQREMGQSLASGKNYRPSILKPHFLTEEPQQIVNLGRTTDDIYLADPSTKVLAMQDGKILITTNEKGQGRSVYFAGFDVAQQTTDSCTVPFFGQHTMKRRCEPGSRRISTPNVAAYPEAGRFVVINNSPEAQSTIVHTHQGKSIHVPLEPRESKWFDMGNS